MSARVRSVSLVKMNGAGNEFVLLDERPARFDGYYEMARLLCDRDGPVGADGLLVLLPANGSRSGAVAALKIINADGSEAEMCGNGARCVARYLAEESGGERRFTIDTPAGTVVTSVEATAPAFRVRVEMPAPVVRRRYADGASVVFEGTSWRFAEVSTGNPHAVMFVDDPDGVDLAGLGEAVSRDPRFADGANVHVARAIDRGTLHARHFERGVGLTRACGSGAVAIAAAAFDDGRVAPAVAVHVPGGVLDVALERNGRAYLTGPAEVEFVRTVEI